MYRSLKQLFEKLLLTDFLPCPIDMSIDGIDLKDLYGNIVNVESEIFWSSEMTCFFDKSSSE